MSKIKNYFHDEIEAQALERHEQSEPDVEEVEQTAKEKPKWSIPSKYSEVW
jgi:hypothetical protein